MDNTGRMPNIQNFDKIDNLISVIAKLLVQFAEVKGSLEGKCESEVVVKLESRVMALESRADKSESVIEQFGTLGSKVEGILKHMQDDSVKDCVERVLDTKTREDKEEEEERSKRKCNIVMFNVAESTEQDVSERQEYDIVSVTEVLNELDVESSVANPVRLGPKKDNSSWPRPLRVTVKDEETKMENIEAGKKLDSLQEGETQDCLPEEGHDTNGEATGCRTEEEPER